MPLSFPSSFPSPSSHSYYAAERELTDVPGGKTRSPDAKSRLLATDAPTPCATITIIATAANTAAAADNPDGEPQQPPPTQAGLPVELEPLLVPVDYEIRYMDEKMPYKAKARSLGVARFPENDLSALVPADPPDKDCSHAKPPHQVPISTFMRYTEPYLRPISEEDMAFLRERGDPVTPYIVPKLGRYYLEQWADEDGANMPAGAGPSALASASSALATTAATATAAAVPPAAGTNSPAARPANAACGGPDDLCNENLDTENGRAARCYRVCWPATCPKSRPTLPIKTPPPAKPLRRRPARSARMPRRFPTRLTSTGASRLARPTVLRWMSVSAARWCTSAC